MVIRFLDVVAYTDASKSFYGTCACVHVGVQCYIQAHHQNALQLLSHSASLALYGDSQTVSMYTDMVELFVKEYSVK